MAEFRLKKRSATAQQQPGAIEVDPEQSASLLSKAGGAAMSGLHTAGSLLSLPSRALWGAANAATGGEGGVGNLNPLDSTGGIELSQFLANKGVIAKNDPSKWEFLPTFENGKINPGDFGRGLIDAVGDPTNVLVPFGLTKAGSLASKAGKLSDGMLSQVAKGERALLSARIPFGESLGHVGTGTKVASQIEKTGIPAAAKYIKESPPVTRTRAIFDATVGGKLTPLMQRLMPKHFKAKDALDNGSKATVIRHAMALKDAGHTSPEEMIKLRMAFEGHAHGEDFLGLSPEIRSVMSDRLAKDLELGVGLREGLSEPHWPKEWTAEGHNPPKAFPRYVTQGGEAATKSGTSNMLGTNTPTERGRSWIYKGQKHGTEGINRLTREHTNGTRNPLYDIKDQLAGKSYNEQVSGIKEGIKQHFGNDIVELYQSDKHLTKTGKAAEKVAKINEAIAASEKSVKDLAAATPEQMLEYGKATRDKNLARHVAMTDDQAIAAGVKRHQNRLDKYDKIANDPAAIAAMTPKKRSSFFKSFAKHQARSPEEVAARALDSHKNLINAMQSATDEQILNNVMKRTPERISRAEKKATILNEVHLPVATKAHAKLMSGGKSRYEELAKKFLSASESEAIRAKGMFGNAPHADLMTYMQSGNRKHAAADTTYDALAQMKHHEGEGGVGVLDYLKAKNFHADPVTTGEGVDAITEAGNALKHVAERAGVSPDDIAKKQISPEMLRDLESLTPKYTAPDAEKETGNAFKSAMAYWKSGTLAAISSRTRDAVGGAMMNILGGHVDPRYTLVDTNALLSGKTLGKRWEKYADTDFVKDWLEKSKKARAPENVTNAVRQAMAVYLPSEAQSLADLSKGQHGADLEHLLHNVPGQSGKTLAQQAFVEPAKTFVGRGAAAADGEIPSWLGHGAPGEGFGSRVIKALKQQLRSRGVGNAEETLFAPVKASEQISAASDQFNRSGSFLDMFARGVAPEEAARRTNSAQVNYDPKSYTAAERWIKNYLSPFYAYNSRMLRHTAGELSDAGSGISNITKAIDRGQSKNDASVPDYVLGGDAIHAGDLEDGTKRYLTSLGLMHAPAVQMLGLGAGALSGKSGYGRQLGYTGLGLLGPHLTMPLQKITGQSLFQGGAPLSGLDPTTPRLLSNIGESTGLLAPDSEPITYPGHTAVDSILGMIPQGRTANTLRTVFDPRKNAAVKAVDSLTGAKITDVSPKKQIATLRKRAQELMKDAGAFEHTNMIFSKEKLAKLRVTNPALAETQDELNALMKQLTGRSGSAKEKKSLEFSLKKR